MRTAAAIFSIVGLAYGHGTITSPQAREPGPAMLAACGRQVYNNQAANKQGNIENMLEVGASQTDFDAATCNAWLCKGYRFDDNTANVQSFSVGQTVPIKVTIGAPHTGTMNVSVVNTATGSAIGDPLIYFDDYASTAHTMPANNTDFSVTIPDVGGQCGTPGACVLQWFWQFSQEARQTYESCVDFTTSGSGGGAAPPPAPPAAPPASSPATPAISAAASVTTRVNVVSPTATVVPTIPESDCDDDDTPAPPTIPETDCDDGLIAAKERRHARDFSAEE